MAASSADFLWYNDVDDESPIGQGPSETMAKLSSSPSSTIPLTPRSSAGPSNRVRQLRGQPKVTINLPSTGHTPIKAIAKTNSRKRPHSNDDNGSTQKSRKTTAAKGKKQTASAVPVDSEPEVDGATSTDHGSSSDDDSDLSVKDICVSLCCIIQLSTDIMYYRNAPAATASVAKTSAALMSTLCLRRDNVIKVAKS
jgi:hypothetical protein